MLAETKKNSNVRISNLIWFINKNINDSKIHKAKIKGKKSGLLNQN